VAINENNGMLAEMACTGISGIKIGPEELNEK
jgi:hypothetical protein